MANSEMKNVSRPLSPQERVDYSDFHQQLLKRRDALLSRDQLDRAQIEQRQTTGESPGDEADISVIDTSADYFMKLADRDRRELLEIRAALAKLHQGTYGICESCENEISRERLRNIPQSRLCIECQSTLESKQKLRVVRPYPKL
jgi:DnaK suppressor protein